jgi:hypothetical protein
MRLLFGWFLALSVGVVLALAQQSEYQYARRNDAQPHDLYILSSILSEANVALIQCYLFPSSSNTTALLTWEEERELCCQAIAKSSVHVMERARIPRECRRQGMPLPSLLPSVAHRQVQPTLVFVESHSMDEIPDLTHAQWSYSTWDDVILLGFLLSPQDAAYRTSFLQRKPSHQEKDDALTTSDPKYFLASMASSLPMAGGMHRAMQHVIDVELPQTTTSGETYEISLWARFLLPPDVFMLSNDVFDDNLLWDLTLHMALGRVLSEEEPAFASPSHAVYIHIQGTAPSASRTIAIEFATKIHFRYPLPSSDPAKTHQIVSLLEPEIIAGEIKSSPNTTASAINNSTFIWQAPGHVRSSTTVLYAQVATPRQSDFTFVLGTTVLVSLVGSIVVGKVTLRAATWI